MALGKKLRSPAVLLIAFAMVIATAGVVYATWTANSTISGEIGTGELVVDVTVDNVVDSETDGGLVDYADCTALVGSGGVLNMAIMEGYPGYWCEFDVTITNNGDMPVKAGDVLAIGSPPLTTNLGYWYLGGLERVKIDGGASIDCLEELVPGDSIEFLSIITVMDTADQNAEYTFGLTQKWRLFNDAGTSCDTYVNGALVVTWTP